MDALDLARWQFGITTIYHFLFVPVTIGLALVWTRLFPALTRIGRLDELRPHAP